jgi:CubicO group peptidase (beta-lactamase class C family)
MRRLMAILLLPLAGCSGAAPKASLDGASAGPTGANDSGQASGGQAGAVDGCGVTRSQLEREMADALDAAATDSAITSILNFTLALEAADGHRFVHSHGDSTLDTPYESASTSKWVAAAVILDLVDQGVLAIGDEAAQWLPFWTAEGVTLGHLLSFTSGFGQEPLCINLPNANFADCVQRAYELNVANMPVAGSGFDYSSTHLQVAGLMALRAAQVESWAELFASWQARTGLFPNGAFDLPSLENPRLAGGMHWTGAEYLEFLRAIYQGSLLAPSTRSAMLDNQRGTARVVASPVLAALEQDWAYGFGNWLECPSATAPDTFNCGAGHRNSSPGAYGAYPFIDFDHDYFGILARQGALGTFREGDALFGVVAELAQRWADAEGCS